MNVSSRSLKTTENCRQLCLHRRRRPDKTVLSGRSRWCEMGFKVNGWTDVLSLRWHICVQRNVELWILCHAFFVCTVQYWLYLKYLSTDTGCWFRDILFHQNARFTLMLTKKRKLLWDFVFHTFYQGSAPGPRWGTSVPQTPAKSPNHGDRSMLVDRMFAIWKSGSVRADTFVRVSEISCPYQLARQDALIFPPA